MSLWPSVWLYPTRSAMILGYAGVVATVSAFAIGTWIDQPERNPKLPMFRFTIRDVLWLMVVVALACAWWGEHSRAKGLARAQSAFEMLSEQISSDGYKATIVGNSLMVAFPDGITTVSEF
jgi:hypothetical protein